MSVAVRSGGGFLRLVPRRARPRIDRARASQAVQGLLALHLPDETLADCLGVIQRDTECERKWPFTMINTEQNLAVLEYLASEAVQPAKAMLVWSVMFDSIRMDSGEVTRRRSEIAARVRVSQRFVSTVASLLERVNAISRERDGRGVRYFINPNVGTHLTGTARDRAQVAAGDLPLFEVVDGDLR